MIAVPIALMILYLVICVFVAVKRKTATSFFRFITVTGCGVLAYFLTMGFKDGVVGFLNDAVLPLIAKNSERIATVLGEVTDLSPAFLLMVEDTVIAAIVPLTFLFVFWALRIVTWLLHKLIVFIVKKCKAFAEWLKGNSEGDPYLPSTRQKIKEKREEKKRREKAPMPKKQVFLCSLCGILQGLVVLFCVMVPFTCYVEMAVDAMDEVADSGVLAPEHSQAVIERKDTWAYLIDEVDSNFTFKAFRAVGTEYLYRMMTDIHIDGDTTISLMEEVDSLSRLTSDVIVFSKNFDLMTYGESEIATVRDFADVFNESELLITMLGEGIYVVTDKWLAGEAVFGIFKPTVAPVVDSLISEVILVLNQDAYNPDHLRGDFYTLVEVAVVLIEDRTIADFKMVELVTENTLNEIANVMNANPRMDHIMTAGNVTATVFTDGFNMLGDLIVGVAHKWFG